MASWIAPQLRRPTSGFTGWVVKRMLQSKNGFIELNAVRLCRLEKHHRVLEVGFGLGIGIKKAAEIIEAGSGKVHGIDFSPEMMRAASTRVEAEVIDGKVELVLGDAACLPYRDNTMDRIFHCNCYYFWPDVNKVCLKLHRVLKDGGIMVTCLSLDRMQDIDSRGYLQCAISWDPNIYIDALKKTGFVNVEMKDEYCDKTKQAFQAIYAYKPCINES
ncbi:phosphoethanolamine N-methyltransferase 2-like [Amphiura filiformis]|uniref:phosphoethanolamine N-methyltransferase 2-like n=1 Tax=Amphiura filiformis TaxID=82378 RepID=UPI003B20FF52